MQSQLAGCSALLIARNIGLMNMTQLLNIASLYEKIFRFPVELKDRGQTEAGPINH